MRNLLAQLWLYVKDIYDKPKGKDLNKSKDHTYVRTYGPLEVEKVDGGIWTAKRNK